MLNKYSLTDFCFKWNKGQQTEILVSTLIIFCSVYGHHLVLRPSDSRNLLRRDRDQKDLREECVVPCEGGRVGKQPPVLPSSLYKTTPVIVWREVFEFKLSLSLEVLDERSEKGTVNDGAHTFLGQDQKRRFWGWSLVPEYTWAVVPSLPFRVQDTRVLDKVQVDY